MARSLRTQVQLLQDTSGGDLIAGAPAWTHYELGPWPKHHDPIFDFTTTAQGFAWLDELAQRAGEVLAQSGPPDAIAHVDWVCMNLRFRDGKVSASYDWDSVAAGPEPILVGLSAGAFTAGSTGGDDAPSPSEVTSFLRDYDEARPQPFSDADQRAAVAGATWVLAYNARCGVSSLADGEAIPDGSPLDIIAKYREGFLDIRW